MQSVGKLLQESELYFDSKDFAGSLEKADQALKVNPDCADAH